MISLLVAMLPIAAFAQTNLESKFQQLLDEKTRPTEMKLASKSSDDTWGSYDYCFTFKASTSRAKQLVNEMSRLFDADEKAAYLLENIDADGTTSKMLRGADGTEYTFGPTNGTTRLACFTDAEDKQYRTAYVLTYKEKGDETRGRFYKFYGRKPSRIFSGSAFDRTKIDSVLNVMQMAIDTTDWKGALRNFGNIFRFKDISSGEGFVKRFSTLRLAFLEAKDQETRTALANSIYDLCRKIGASATERERKLCIQQLREMKAKESDSMVKGILEEAVQTLKD